MVYIWLIFPLRRSFVLYLLTFLLILFCFLNLEENRYDYEPIFP